MCRLGGGVRAFLPNAAVFFATCSTSNPYEEHEIFQWYMTLHRVSRVKVRPKVRANVGHFDQVLSSINILFGKRYLRITRIGEIFAIASIWLRWLCMPALSVLLQCFEVDIKGRRSSSQRAISAKRNRHLLFKVLQVKWVGKCDAGNPNKTSFLCFFFS